MLKFRRPVPSILSAILICGLLMVSSPVLDTLINPEGSSSGISEVLADDGCEGCSGTYDAWVQAKEKYEQNSNSTTYQNYLAASNKFIQCLNQGCDAGEAPDSGGESDPCLRGYGTCAFVWQGYERCLKECFERYNACEQAYKEYEILAEKYGQCLESITRCDVPESLVFHGLTAEEYLEKCRENYDACKPTCNGDSECLENCEKNLDDCKKAYDEYIAFKAECDADHQSFCEGDAEILLQKVIAANNKYVPLSADSTCDNGGGDPVCGDGSCEIDMGESCANCLSDCPCSSGEACQTSDSNADPWGCVVVAVPNSMALTVNTDKKTYSPEETVIVSGSVRDAKSGEPISGANVAIDINPKVSTTTDSSGNYKKGVPLPPDISQGTHTVTVTASKTGYPDVSGTTSFSVEQALIVEISTDKLKCESLLSLVGEEIYCTITVKDAATGKLVPYADLKIIATHLCTRKGTRKVTELSGATDGIGESTWSFTLEERLKIEVTASRDGYSDGYKSIIYPEDCFWSPEVCKCDANMICDPWSEYADLFGCSPKVAYVILNPEGVNFWEMWWATADIKKCRRMYKESGYKVRYLDMGKESSIIMLNALQNPSTKAIGYFGHSAVPELGGTTAARWRVTLHTCLLERYKYQQCMDVEEAESKAKEDANQINLDCAYLWTCHSLDDTSLPDWLLHNGGVVWGTRGDLYVISGPDIKLRKTENGIYEKSTLNEKCN